MARRIWKSKYNFYLWLIILPNFALALVLLSYPDVLLSRVFLDPADYVQNRNTVADFLARLLGGAWLLLHFILQMGRHEPKQFRSIFFWFALLYFSMSVVTVLSPFFPGLSWWTYLALLCWFPATIFLMSFASRNLLVRE